jgi:uncharacterized protein (DUF1015 family)
MATFVRMEADGLTILPTHRVVHGLPNFDWQRFVDGARATFEVQALPDAGPSRAGSFHERLASAGRERPSIGVYAGRGRALILRLRQDVNVGELQPDVPATVAQLDVVILHRLLLERILGIDRQAVREERNIEYAREFDRAMQAVEEGKAQVFFLLNATPIEAVRDNAFAGHVLPQKSTDFYPKLLSGLTIYWLDNPAGI